MRVLLIGPRIEKRADLKNFTGVWSWYLSRALAEQGAEIFFSDPKATNLYTVCSDVDHVVALGLRFFEKVSALTLDAVKRRIRGAVTQIHDGTRSTTGVDCTFCIKSDKGLPRNHQIGWAADPELFVPRQGDSHVLIDHANFSLGHADFSGKVVSEALELKRSYHHGGHGVTIQRIIDKGVEDIDYTSGPPPCYHREPMPYEQLAAELSMAHVFMATHPESVGLTALEAAMSGALVVAPEGCIAKELLATIRHVEWQGSVPWGTVSNLIDPKASREKAMANTWDKVAARVLGWLDGFRK